MEKSAMSQEERPWRQLLYVNKLDNDFAYVLIPGWDGGRAEVPLELETLPSDLTDLLEPGYRFHAEVNIGAQTAEKLYFQNFELT